VPSRHPAGERPPAAGGRARRNPVREFVDGLGLVGRGIGMWARSPGLLLLGAVPALIAFVVLTAAFVVLCVFVTDIVGWATPFADGWAAGTRETVRVLLDITLLGSALLVAVLTFTALTMAIGDPCYEAISRRVDDGLGGVPGGEVEVPWWRSLRRSLADAVRLVLASAVTGLVLFAAGFLPAVGQTAVPVIGALIGGWYLAVELTGVAFERRGRRLADRRRALRGRRFLAVGFGTGVFVLFLIPLGAILVTPAAVAGATLLTRRVLGEPDRPVVRQPVAAGPG
jgi:CysZ protein